MITWSTEKKSTHGSLPSVTRRCGTVCTVKAAGSVFADTSAQASGVDTGAPRFARGE